MRIKRKRRKKLKVDDIASFSKKNLVACFFAAVFLTSSRKEENKASWAVKNKIKKNTTQ